MLPARSQSTTLKQILELIPRNLVPKLATEHGVDKKCRSFSPWSHVVAMVHAQLAHALSLNDVCDTLRHHSGVLTTVRHATPPSRNGLSHANRERDADMAEALFWEVTGALQKQTPGFGRRQPYVALPRRFKRVINILDATTMQLVANCMDWAKHRRRKAAAKCHMCLDLQTFLPRFAVVKAANTHDSTEAWQVCAGIRDGEIVLFDKAYVDFEHLFHLDERGVFWVTRAKGNMRHEVVRQNSAPAGRIISDQIIRMTGTKTAGHYPRELRRVKALVEIDGKDQTMVFITNNLEWSARSICDLYKARWGIEVFFKQLKQTLNLADFLGYSENAVRWQIWTALLTYVLLRYLAHCHKWTGSLARLFTTLRGVLWSRYDIASLLKLCGTASGPPRTVCSPQQAFLPGLAL